jgi:hypothetical protein
MNMTNESTLRRQRLRAALRIHDHLCRADLSAGLVDVPVAAWHELQLTASRLQHVLARGWVVASQHLLDELGYVVRQLERQLINFREQLPRSLSAGLLSTPREISDDLLALEQEFDEFTLDLKEQTLTALTGPIDLEGVALGTFRIILHWNRIGQGKAYEVEATEPCPAEGNEEVTHPHVRDRLLCEGEGTAPIRAALSQGRLLDFFTLVRQILETYNADSAHVSLDRWNGVNCCDCGWRMSSQEHGSCERCDAALCSDCSSGCQNCDLAVCGECTAQCAECDDYFCLSCLKSTASSQLICKSCLEAREEQPNDVEDEFAADDSSALPDAGQESLAPSPLALQPVCLGEAALYA